MKIGILTFHNAPNAGAILQAYSLQCILENMGHEVEFIDIRYKYKYTYKQFIAKKRAVIFRKWANEFHRWKYNKKGINIWNKILHKSIRSYYNYEEIKNDPPVYDVYIVGSDQVWNFRKEIQPLYLLDFVPRGKKKIAYSVSMGQCLLEDTLKEEFKNYLIGFNALSVREDKTCTYINDLLKDENLYVEKCVDPTLLVMRSCFDGIKQSICKRNKMVVSYLLNELNDSEVRIFLSWCRSHDFELVNLRNPDTGMFIPHVRNIIVNPQQWISYISDSEYVICGSFHATVFSLIYHKQFIVVESEQQRKQGGNLRVRSLLEPLGLSNRIIEKINDIAISNILDIVIDWAHVDNLLNIERNKSIEFLQKNI